MVVPRFTLSFQLYSARHFPPLGDQLPVLKAMGYDSVEPWGPAYESNPKQFRQMIDDAGLACSGFHISYDGLVNDTQRYVDIANTIGTNLMIPPWLSPGQRPSDADGWKRIGAAISKGAETAAASGVKVAWHNHDFEFIALPDGSLPIDHLMGAADNFGLEIDCGWIARAGADPAKALKTYANRIHAIQAKDTAPIGTREDDGWVATGDGIIDWTSLVPLFKATVSNQIVAEHDNPADWKVFAQRTISYLRSLPLN